MTRFIDESIDIAIGEARNATAVFRDPEIKEQLELKDENEFVLGMIWGMAIKQFQSLIVVKERRQPTGDELAELAIAVLERIPQIRNAIMKVGG